MYLRWPKADDVELPGNQLFLMAVFTLVPFGIEILMKVLLGESYEMDLISSLVSVVYFMAWSACLIEALLLFCIRDIGLRKFFRPVSTYLFVLSSWLLPLGYLRQYHQGKDNLNAIIVPCLLIVIVIWYIAPRKERILVLSAYGSIVSNFFKLLRHLIVLVVCFVPPTVAFVPIIPLQGQASNFLVFSIIMAGLIFVTARFLYCFEHVNAIRGSVRLLLATTENLIRLTPALVTTLYLYDLGHVSYVVYFTGFAYLGTWLATTYDDASSM